MLVNEVMALPYCKKYALAGQFRLKEQPLLDYMAMDSEDVSGHWRNKDVVRWARGQLHIPCQSGETWSDKVLKDDFRLTFLTF